MPLLALPVGVMVGVVLGALGGGGAILTVPALVYLLGLSPAAATTASLVIVGLTAAAGVLPHHRDHSIRYGPGLAFALTGTAGAYLGARAADGISPDLLLAAFSALMLGTAAVMATGQRATTPTSACPTLWTGTCPARLVAGGLAVGLLTGFLGVGGGFLIVPVLVLVLGFDLRAAAGTSLLVIALNSATALAARLTTTDVTLDWRLIGAFTLLSITGAVLGTKASRRLDLARLNKAFITLLVTVALYTAARSAPALI